MTDATMIQYLGMGLGVSLCFTASALWLYVLARKENAVLRKEADRLHKEVQESYKDQLVLKTWAPITKKPLILSDRRFIPTRLIREDPGAHMALLEAEHMVKDLLQHAKQYVKVDSHASVDGIEVSASLMLIDQKGL